MNKSIPFGYHHIGSHTVIKLNMNLTPADAHEMEKMFGLHIRYVGKNGSMLYRIEGVVLWSSEQNLYEKWFKQLEICKLNARIEKLAQREASLLDKAIGAENLIIDLYELPF
jgi:hypothetical protein